MLALCPSAPLVIVPRVLLSTLSPILLSVNSLAHRPKTVPPGLDRTCINVLILNVLKAATIGTCFINLGTRLHPIKLRGIIRPSTVVVLPLPPDPILPLKLSELVSMCPLTAPATLLKVLLRTNRTPSALTRTNLRRGRPWLFLGGIPVMAFLRTPSSVRRIFLLSILWATEGPLSWWETPLTLLIQTTLCRVSLILKLVVRTRCRRTPLILLFMQLVLANAAVLVTVKGILKVPVKARVNVAPFMLAGFSNSMPSPFILAVTVLLQKTCPQRPHIVIDKVIPVLLRLTIHLLRWVPTLPGAGNIGGGAGRPDLWRVGRVLLLSRSLYSRTYLP